MTDPVRWRNDPSAAPPGFADALERDDFPPDEAVARIESKLVAMLGPLGASGGGHGGGGAGGAAGDASGGAGPSAAPRGGAPPAGPAAGAALAVGKALVFPSDAKVVIASLAVGLTALGATKGTALLRTHDLSEAPLSAPAATVAAAPREQTIAPPTLPRSPPAVPPASGGVHRSETPKLPVAAAAPAPPPESELLGRAQAALRTDPASALRIANEHARSYPNGVLAQEREVIVIEALVRTGKRSEAQARADGFRAAYPGSGHARRLETILAQ